jgi:hypothetical protein
MVIQRICPFVSPLSSLSLSLHLSAHLECFLCVSFVCSSSSSSTLPFVFVPHCLLALFLLFFNHFAQAVFVSFVCVCPGRVPGLEYRRRNLFFPCAICLLVRKTRVAQGADTHNQHTYSWNPFHPGLMRHGGTHSGLSSSYPSALKCSCD